MTPLERLQEIKGELTRKGWDQGGQPPDAVKRNLMGTIVAAAGGQEWIEDVQKAIETVEAREAMAELRRRYADEAAAGPRVAQPLVNPLNPRVPG